MNYAQVVDWLCNELPFFYKEGSSAYKKDLNNIKLLLDYIGNPHKKFKSIHIAGTNGKGSVSNILSSVLQDSGYKVGLFTSPHILDFRERIKINGKKIDKKFIISFVNQNYDLNKNINFSFFEITTAMAFSYFNFQKVDLAIIECGLGGRLDSTNIINPILSVITNVSFDHVNILGDNLLAIAKEKAGVIKEGVPILTSEKKSEVLKLFKEVASKKNAPFFVSNNISLKDELISTPNFQLENISTVKSSVDILHKIGFDVTENNFDLGIKKLKKNTGFLGRWDIVSSDPLIILDIAHNERAVELVMNQLSKIDKKKHIILGFSSDKDLDRIFNKININASYYFCGSSRNKRVLNPKKYLKKIQSLNYHCQLFQDSLEAFRYVQTILRENDMIFVTGSAFIVSDVAVNFR